MMMISLGFLIFFPLFYISWKVLANNTCRRKEAPQPVGKLPLIGHLLRVARSTQQPFRLFSDMADQCGPIFTLFLGSRRTVIISNAELAKECFTSNDKILASRPALAFGKYMGYNNALFVAASNGPYWREVRKISNVELLSSTKIEQLKHIRIKEIDLSLKSLYGKKNSNGKFLPVTVDMKEWVSELVFNVVTMNLAGKRYFGDEATGDKNEGKKVQEALKMFFYLSGLFLVSDAIPWLEWLDLGGHIKAMKQVSKELDLFLSSWLEEHKLWQGSNQGQPKRDFLDVLLGTSENLECGEYDFDVVVKALLLVLLTGANDTTSITLTWALAHLLKNPLILRKAQNEADIVIGKERRAKELDIQNMPYLQAIFKETLRLYSSTPMTVTHISTEDCKIGNYDIPSGTRLIANLWKIHRDPTAWDAPLEYRPERFLNGEGKGLQYEGCHFDFIPFGSGRRMCPGFLFAEHVIHLTLARIIHEFDVKVAEGDTIDMTEGFGMTLTKATPLNVIITPRQKLF